MWQEKGRLIALCHRENDRKSFFPLALIATVEFGGMLPDEHPTSDAYLLNWVLIADTCLISSLIFPIPFEVMKPRL